ncbi:putative protein disulfide isomerase [Cafeteria roenbergensis virus]|uniref:Thioredoxin domain-containing protein n=1 Tax=Cafeteria roenbergensis virus (strain BV-PW1) TaxID=693272 RepID=E3T5F0_CROVB|nr:thioredoxin domain [Cafeteria roenbergensis virus BV-PW1]ADO67413.1 putative protein disulfide isomerase [Cafeteria roenbergensis virus BV-PW1]
MKTYQEKYLKYKNKYIQLKNKIDFNLNMSGGGNNKTLTFIKAEWCGHCKNFTPIWDELPKHLNNINFKVLDSDTNKEEIKKYNIKGYPSIFLEVNNNIISYEGGRTIEKIKEFVKKTS